VIRGVALLALIIAGLTGAHWITLGEKQQAIEQAGRLNAEKGTKVVLGRVYEYKSIGAHQYDSSEKSYRFTYRIEEIDYNRRGWPQSSNSAWLRSEAKWTPSSPESIGLPKDVKVRSSPVHIRYVDGEPSVWGVDGWPRRQMSTFERVFFTALFAFFGSIAMLGLFLGWITIGTSFYGAVLGDQGGTKMLRKTVTPPFP
jgi:hypothetical protein